MLSLSVMTSAINIIFVFVTVDIKTLEVLIMCGNLYPYQILCVNLGG
jgi:hypothetical protein